MYHKKTGLPEEGSLVICTVKKIQHAIFTTLDEYENREGIIHISEVAPGRIRNLRDYVKEGKRVVCKVLRINKEKNHIDLSLRRVSFQAAKIKNELYKQEEKAEKILELLAQQTKKTLPEMYKEVGDKIIEKYDLLMPFFQSILLNGEKPLKDLNIKPNYIKPLIKIIQEKVNLPEAKISKIIKLESFEPNGIEIIKNTLSQTKNLANNKKYTLEINYISAPRYKITITTQDFKTAENQIKEITEFAKTTIEKNKGFGEILNE